jgi:large subunit ribosomal protein L29
MRALLSTPRRPPVACRQSVACHAVDMVEARKMSTSQIDERVYELKVELLRMRMIQSEGFQVKGYTKMRKDVARLLTIKREQEIAEGVTKRDSRKMKKAAERADWQFEKPQRYTQQ